MVRGGYVRKPDGSRVWREWSPQPCLSGHDEWAPSTQACPTCRWGVRVWTCRECDELVYDPDHVHGE
ncbi:hypothetical protein [Micromonospora sp. DT47]|uniref:hypothetical protein n=1 Tax=Micromonospora sp. DT47 TaxID=3393431 RepID=UPI003CEC76A7